MNPGRLDTKIDLMQPSQSGTVLNDPHAATEYGRQATRRGELKHLRGNELEQARSMKAEITVKITLRHDTETAQIKANWRLVAANQTFDVLYTVPIPGGDRPKRIECYCKSI